MEAGSVNQDPETDSGTVLSSDSSQTSQSAMLGDSSVTEQVGTSGYHNFSCSHNEPS